MKSFAILKGRDANKFGIESVQAVSLLYRKTYIFSSACQYLIYDIEMRLHQGIDHKTPSQTALDLSKVYL